MSRTRTSTPTGVPNIEDLVDDAAGDEKPGEAFLKPSIPPTVDHLPAAYQSLPKEKLVRVKIKHGSYVTDAKMAPEAGGQFARHQEVTHVAGSTLLVPEAEATKLTRFGVAERI